jgi:hypothetical protein
MSTSATILAYINALKWPVFAGIMIYAFRAPLKALGKRMTESEKASIKSPLFDISYEGITKGVQQTVIQEAVNVKEGSGALSTVAALSAGAEVVKAAPSSPPTGDKKGNGSLKREWLPAPPSRAKWLRWQQIKKTADDDPSAAVKLGWDELDGEISEYKARVLKHAADAGEDIEGGDVVFTKNLQDAISKLQVLYNNVVVLKVPPTPDEARAFVGAAEEVASLLRADYRGAVDTESGDG